MEQAKKLAKRIKILMADDDAEDRILTKEAFEESYLLNDLEFVEDGQELMEYLRKEGKYANVENHTLPGLILLDLNMPRKDGREALKEIKSHPDFRKIPVVILTTSRAHQDIVRTYDLGVNCFITKPVSFNELIEVTRTLGKFWFEIVELPPVE